MRYILIVALLFQIQAKAQIQPFLGIFDLDSCHFESACHLFNPDTALSNTWQVGGTSKPFFGNAFSPPNAVMTDTLNPYPILNHSWFDLVLPNNQYYYLGMIVSFQHKYQTDSGSDGGYIEVSYDKGQSWHNVVYEDTITNPPIFATQNMYGKNDTLVGGIPAFSGVSSGWVQSSIQWVWAFPLRILPDTLLLRFHFVSDSIPDNFDGWMIDNVLISYADLGAGIVEKEAGDLIIYPNPSDDFLFVSSASSFEAGATLTILNAAGRQVMPATRILGREQKVDCSSLDAGLYFYVVAGKSGFTRAGKFIKK